MRVSIYLFVCFLFIACKEQEEKNNSEMSKKWIGYLEIGENKTIPFTFEFVDSSKIVITNGKERILVKGLHHKESIKFPFENYNSFLEIKKPLKDTLMGVFINEDRKENKSIPFFAYPNIGFEIIDRDKEVITQKWEVYFNYNSPSKYPAIGLFSIFKNNSLEGTFLTETGDYRYLSGKIEDNKLQLSCFDGSHAFLFEAEKIGDSLNGLFYSGAHWKTNWFGLKNDTFELNNPYEITQLVNDKKLQFSKLNLEKDSVYFPNNHTNGKVIIIQIFGSWCPNCMDEIMFFNELYKEYKNKGLEIIGLGYEIPVEIDDKINRLKKLKERKRIDYTLLLGGDANKQKASEDFPMLNSITSFPTTLILNRKGEIIKTHTGFNGPGTGEIYKTYKEEMKNTIEKLLNE